MTRVRVALWPFASEQVTSVSTRPVRAMRSSQSEARAFCLRCDVSEPRAQVIKAGETEALDGREGCGDAERVEWVVYRDFAIGRFPACLTERIESLLVIAIGEGREDLVRPADAMPVHEDVHTVLTAAFIEVGATERAAIAPKVVREVEVGGHAIDDSGNGEVDRGSLDGEPCGVRHGGLLIIQGTG